MTRRNFSSTLLAGAASASAAPRQPLMLGAPIHIKSTDPANSPVSTSASATPPPTALRQNSKTKSIFAPSKKPTPPKTSSSPKSAVWVNLLDADPAKRAANLKTVTDGLALADEVGARCCVDIAGSFNRQGLVRRHIRRTSRRSSSTPSVENARKIIDAVKPKRSKFAYEMMGWAISRISPTPTCRLIKAVDRPGLRSPHRHLQSRSTHRSVSTTTPRSPTRRFDKLGRWIVSCHAKDLSIGSRR